MTINVMHCKAGEFKAKCLKLMDFVKESKEEITITKYGKPVAKLVPVNPSEGKQDLFGLLKGSIEIKGDILSPINETWNAEL